MTVHVDHERLAADLSEQVQNLKGKLECRESQLAFVAHRYRETRRELAVAEGEIDRLEAELAGYTEPISKVIQGPWPH